MKKYLSLSLYYNNHMRVFMRKLAILLTVLFSLMGCDEVNNSIDNESSYDIVFFFMSGPAEQITVLSGRSYTGDGLKNPNGAELMSFESDIPKRAGYVKTSFYNGKFIDLQPINVIINNTMSFPVSLSAGGYLENDPMLNIPMGDNNTNIIYTETPILTVTTNSFPATAEYQIINNIMYIIIK